MKTPSMIIAYSCPNCERSHKDDITNFKYDFQNQRLYTYRTCYICNVDFSPTIHLNEFKEKEEVKDGCVCDLGEGETPTLCVIDDPEYGTTDCVHAASGKQKKIVDIGEKESKMKFKEDCIHMSIRGGEWSKRRTCYKKQIRMYYGSNACHECEFYEKERKDER